MRPAFIWDSGEQLIIIIIIIAATDCVGGNVKMLHVYIDKFLLGAEQFMNGDLTSPGTLISGCLYKFPWNAVAVETNRAFAH